jgi:hypothetical protein
MQNTAEFYCAYCGEENTTFIDFSAGVSSPMEKIAKFAVVPTFCLSALTKRHWKLKLRRNTKGEAIDLSRTSVIRKLSTFLTQSVIPK